MVKFRSSSWLVALATSVAATPAARAQEDVGSILEVLEENVVSGASRSAERDVDAPAMSSVVTAEQLRAFGIRRVEEAINFLSLGFFAHDRMGLPEVGARGVALTRDMNNHVLVLLDGTVVNEQAGGGVSLRDIPLEVVDHIEFILGPGSVLYGSNAMLGVINVVTKSARDHAGAHATTSFGTSPRIDSDGSLGTPTLDSMGRDHRFTLSYGHPFKLWGLPAGVVASAEYDDFQGPTFAFPKQPLPQPAYGSASPNFGPHTEPGFWGGPVSEQWYARHGGGYLRLDLGDFSWATHATMTRFAMPQVDLDQNRAGAFDDPHNHDTNDLLVSTLGYRTRLTEKLTGLGRAYFGYSNNLRSRYVIGHEARVPGVPLGVLDPEQCPIGPVGPCRQERRILSRWVGLEAQGTLDWFGDGAFSTMVGVDGRLRTSAYEFVSFDDLTGRSYGSDPALTRWHGGGHAQADEYALGAYVQQTVKPWKYFGFNGGLRADLDSRIPPKYTADALSPRVAIIATPTERMSLKLIYSKAFRAPSFVESKVVNGRLLPNPDGLKPETVWSLEAVAAMRVGSQRWTLGGFYATWHDLIELELVKAQAPAVSHYGNVPGIRNYGANLSYETSFFERKFRVGWNSTFAIATRQLSSEQVARNQQFNVGSETPVTVAPRVYGNARASYSFPAHTIAVAAGYFGRRIADQAYYAGEPSNLVPRPEAPAQLELRAVFTGAVPGVDHVGYSLGGQYAFASHEPYVVGPVQGEPRYLVPQEKEGQLALVNRLTVFAGLEIDLDGFGNAEAADQPKEENR